MDYIRFLKCLQFRDVDSTKTSSGTEWVLNTYPLDDALSAQIEYLFTRGQAGAKFRLPSDEYNKFAVDFRTMQVHCLGQGEKTLLMERNVTVPAAQCLGARPLIALPTVRPRTFTV